MIVRIFQREYDHLNGIVFLEVANYIRREFMEPTIIAISVGTFIAILGILVLLRAKNSKYEVRPTDIVVAVLPIVIFLLVPG